MPILSSFAGASARAYGLGAGVTAVVGYNSIASTTVGSGGAANIEFTGIPSTYKHLQIRAIGRTTSTGADTYLQINGVTAGGNYSYHYLYSTGASSLVAGVDTTQGFLIGIRNATSTESANVFGIGVVDILDYADTNKFKTVRTLSGLNNNGTGFEWLASGNFRSTNATTSIKFTPASGNFAQYTSFALYGMAG